MYKILLLFLIFFIFNGCSNKKNIFLYKTQQVTLKNKWFNDCNINNSITDDVLKNDNDLFGNNEGMEDNSILNINEDYLINPNKDIEYTDLKTAYEYVIKFQNLNDINLKSYDYLKLYKALRLSQNGIFKNLKNIIIKRFMISIEYNNNYDKIKIKKVLEKENIEKINILIKLLNKGKQ